MTTNLYTVIFDFGGGTYLHQVWAATVRGALEAWAQWIGAGAITGADLSEAAQAIHSASDDPEPIEELQDVWCVSADVDGEVALVHIVRTAGGA